MTENEIIKALECCIFHGEIDVCEACPLLTNIECCDVLKENALDLINSQKAEIEKLKSLCTAKDVIIEKQEAEIKSLNAKEDFIRDFVKKIIDAIDEGRISHSIDIVDFTAEYIEKMETLK